MTNHVTLPTTDTLRALMADTQRTATQVLAEYQQQLERNPGNQPLREVAETIQRLTIELTFREASFADLFAPDRPCNNAFDEGTKGHHKERMRPIPLKTYSASRNQGVNNVTVSNFTMLGSTTTWLDPRQDLVKHSPKDLQWGAGRPKATLQLGLALLADFAGDEYAVAHHEVFSNSVLQHLPYHGWTITADQLAGWVRDHPMPTNKAISEPQPQLSLIAA